MGERVTQSRRGDVVRAQQLKKALASGAAPTFVPADGAASPVNGACSEKSCPVPESAAPSCTNQAWTNQVNAATRVQYLEQMFQASPDGLSLADCDHRVLWANETFVRMFGYAASEVAGQSLENLVVPADRLAESRWVTEALAKGERI